MGALQVQLPLVRLPYAAACVGGGFVVLLSFRGFALMPAADSSCTGLYSQSTENSQRTSRIALSVLALAEQE